MVLKEFRLEGKTALVTGAGRGIGKGIALALAEAGADIVATARTQKELEQTAQEVRKLGRKCLAIPTDVTKANQVQSMAEKAVAEFEHIDILVNNAGVVMLKPLASPTGFTSKLAKVLPEFNIPYTEEDWHRVIDTNLTGVFLCCRAVGPQMIQHRRGKIINIASTDGTKALTYETAYCASKGGVIMFTKALALEWARYNINVNAIGPGNIETKMIEYATATEELKEATLRTIPLRRIGSPRDIGLLAVYLASEASDYMTGQTIFIDGGYLA